MNKLVICFSLFFITLNAYSQKWKTVKIDSAVSVDLPADFIKETSKDQYSLMGRTSFGTILVFKTPDDIQVFPDIEKEKHLKKYYSSYIKKIQKSASQGIIIDEKDTTLENLRVKDFTLQVDTGSGKQYRNFRILHANSATYAFEFLYKDIHTEYAKPEREQFFNSIKVNEDLERKDQYIETDNGIAGSSNKTLIYIGIAITMTLIIALIFFLMRKKTHE